MSYALKQMKKDQIDNLVVTMASAVPYAFVMRELARLRYGGEYQPRFFIFDPALHPVYYRKHGYARNVQELYLEQQNRFKKVLGTRSNGRIGVFDEAGGTISGESIRITQEHISSICRKNVWRYACGRKGVMTSRNAESDCGKIIMRDEELVCDKDGAVKRFLVRDLKDNVRRSARKLFEGLPENQLLEYIEFRGCWRAVGKCGLKMIEGYNNIAKETYKAFS